MNKKGIARFKRDNELTNRQYVSLLESALDSASKALHSELESRYKIGDQDAYFMHYLDDALRDSQGQRRKQPVGLGASIDMIAELLGGE